MASSLEMFRRAQQGRGNSYVDWHRVNHTIAKDIREKQKRGHSRKEDKARSRKLERSRFNEALLRMLDGQHSHLDMKLVITKLPQYEQQVATFSGRNEMVVTATVVDLPRRNGIGEKGFSKG